MNHPIPIWTGRIQDGKIRLEQREAFAALLRRLEGCQVKLWMTKLNRPRSLSQNAYYWGVVVALLAEHCGYEPEEMHEALKERFLRDREHEMHGLQKTRSTASLSTAEMCEYIEACCRLGAELGVVIPEPGESSCAGT
jgi:hypothetical protein